MGLPGYIAFLFIETPTITHPTTSNVSYDEGSPVSISCKATGKPDPDVRWIHHDNGQVKSAGSKSAHLTFATISKADAGMYTCRANNSVESTEKQLNPVTKCECKNCHFNYIINLMK